MNSLHVYAGVGMHTLGFQRAGFTPVGLCEIDPYCRAVLAKHWPGVFIHDDVRTLSVDAVRARCGRIDLLEGGFMCTDISQAGKGRGLTRTTRSGITWRNFFRLARGLRPDWLVLENVPRLRSVGADRVLRALERIGYACWPLVVGAIHVGASFVGQRVWIVAASRVARLQAGREVSGGGVQAFALPAGGCLHRGVAGSRERQHEWEEPRLVEPPMGVPVDGATRRLDRFASERAIHAVGNGNPPALAELIARAVLVAAAPSVAPGGGER
jgi:DNA (cytosine-5)-methyltransferase 1